METNKRWLQPFTEWFNQKCFTSLVSLPHPQPPQPLRPMRWKTLRNVTSCLESERDSVLIRMSPRFSIACASGISGSLARACHYTFPWLWCLWSLAGSHTFCSETKSSRNGLHVGKLHVLTICRSRCFRRFGSIFCGVVAKECMPF